MLDINLGTKDIILMLSSLGGVFGAWYGIKWKVKNLEEDIEDLSERLEEETDKREQLSKEIKIEQEKRFGHFEKSIMVTLKSIEDNQKKEYQRINQSQAETRQDVRDIRQLIEKSLFNNQK